MPQRILLELVELNGITGITGIPLKSFNTNAIPLLQN
jgi:hypothetical protein